MSKDTIVGFRTPASGTEDPLTELLQQGARQLIAAAVEAELAGFLQDYQTERDALRIPVNVNTYSGQT